MKVFFFLFLFILSLNAEEEIYQTIPLFDFEKKQFSSKNLKEDYDKKQKIQLNYSEIFLSPYILTSKKSLLLGFDSNSHDSFELSLNSKKVDNYVQSIEFHFYNSDTHSAKIYLILIDANKNTHKIFISDFLKRGWNRVKISLQKIFQDDIIFRKKDFIIFHSIIYQKGYKNFVSNMNFFIVFDDILVKVRKKYLLPTDYLNF